MLACLHRQRLELAGCVRARQEKERRLLPLSTPAPADAQEEHGGARRRRLEQPHALSAATASPASLEHDGSGKNNNTAPAAANAANAAAAARQLTRRITTSRDWRAAARAYDEASARGLTNAIHLAAAAWLAARAAGQGRGGGETGRASAASAAQWLLAAFSRDLARVLPDCEPRQLATLLWSLSAAANHPSDELQSQAEALAGAMAAAADRAAARDLVGAAWALASLQASSSSASSHAAAARLMPDLWRRLDALPSAPSPQELATLLRAAANLFSAAERSGSDSAVLILPPSGWLKRVWRASSAPGWWHSLSSSSLLAGALWGAARLGCGGSIGGPAAPPPPPAAWTAGLLEALARAAPRATVSEAASVVGALRMLEEASSSGSLPREEARAWLGALSSRAWGEEEEASAPRSSPAAAALATLAREVAALGAALEDDEDLSALLAQLQRQVQAAAVEGNALSPAEAAALARAARAAATPPAPLPWASSFLERVLLLREDGPHQLSAEDLALVASVAAAAAGASSSLPAAGPAAVAAALLRRARRADDPGVCAPAVLVAVCRLRDVAAEDLQQEAGAPLLTAAAAEEDLSAVAAAALAAAGSSSASPPSSSVSAAACVHAAAALGFSPPNEAAADAALDAALSSGDEREVGVSLRAAALWATATAAAAAAAAAAAPGPSAATTPACPSPAWWSRARTEAVAPLLRRVQQQQQQRGGRAAAARAAVRMLAALTPALSSSPPSGASPPSAAAPMQLDLRRDLWRSALLHRHEADPKQAAELLLLAGRAAGGRLRPPSARWLEAALRPVVVGVGGVGGTSGDTSGNPSSLPSPEQWLQLLRVLARWRCPSSPERDAVVAAAAAALAPASAGAERAARALRAASRLPEPFPALDAGWVDAVVDAVSEVGVDDGTSSPPASPIPTPRRGTRGQRRPAPPAAVAALALGRLLAPAAADESNNPSPVSLSPDRARRLLAAVARALPHIERPSLAVAVLHSSAAIAARASSAAAADRAAAPVAEAFLDLCAERGPSAFGAAMGGVPGFAKAAWALAKAGAVVMDDAMLREVMDAACWGGVEGGEEAEAEEAEGESGAARPRPAAPSTTQNPPSPWTPQRLANTLCAFTRLGFNPGADRLARLGAQARESGALGGGGGGGGGGAASPMAALDQEVIVAAWAELNASYRPSSSG